MRGLVYAVAVLAAAGIMYSIAMMPPNDGPTVEAETVAAESSDIMAEPGQLTLSVPNMHCPVVCYPQVKESLESTAGVTEVVLDKQKEEGVIDNRQVVVSYDAGFDLNAALANLSKSGFKEADVVQ